MKNKKIILLIALIVCIAATVVAIATGVSSKQGSSTTTTNEIKISTTVEKASSGITSKADNTTLSSTTKQNGASTSKNIETTKATTESTTKNNTTVSQAKATTSVKATTKINTTTAKATTETTVTTSESNVCYITIECTEILNNMDKLKEGHSAYVPSNGYILNNYPVEISNGYSAYDVLKKACNDNNIKLTATTTAYGTYVSGINNLDEFDCGNQSGWLYYVDNNYQNVSCDKRTVKPNETITFHYTTK